MISFQFSPGDRVRHIAAENAPEGHWTWYVVEAHLVQSLSGTSNQYVCRNNLDNTLFATFHEDELVLLNNENEQ